MEAAAKMTLEAAREAGKVVLPASAWLVEKAAQSAGGLLSAAVAGALTAPPPIARGKGNKRKK